mmetsp:Transcript_120067/g.346852  ORF Transcript_120067/g.346852 Transcript_120067/m.346852 type:complete len:193 (-) Transcript_120067:123-701(-)
MIATTEPIRQRIIVSETEPVVTPRDPNARHNFGPIACCDKTLYTAERPGHPGKDGVPTEIVDDWIQFILSKGIKNVLIIMEDDEFGVYEVDLKEFYENAGLTVYHIPFSSQGSYEKTMALIKQLDEKGEKVVSHCTGGKGRCGRVACAWLCKKWHLSPLEASQEFIDQATANGLYRLGDVQKLKAWIGYGSC